jgi:hypothetical protein
MSDSQEEYAAQLSTGVDNFNVHLPLNLLATVVQNQVTMTPMERFEDPSAFPYQQHNTYIPLPNYSYHSTPQYETLTPYHHSDDTSSTQMSSGYSSVWGADREPQYSEHHVQSWAATDGLLDEGDIAGVGTQFDY